MSNEEFEKLLEELKIEIKTLQASLLKEIPMLFSSAIDPCRAIVFREACLYRITELAESAYEAFLKDRLVTAFILCRAFMETESLFLTFIDRLKESLATRAIDNIRSFLGNSLAGVKDEQIRKFKGINNPGTKLEPINVLTLIKNVGKKITSYPLHYASLCEFSHPNAAGIIGAYVTLDRSTNTASFGKNKKLTPELALPQLVVSLQAFTHFYNQSAILVKEFAVLCESLISTQEPPLDQGNL